MPGPRWVCRVFACCALIALVSCETPSLQTAPSPRSETTTFAAPHPMRVALVNTPKDIREDYVYPPALAFQKLVWSDNGMEWHIAFPPTRYAYGGIVLRHPLDLSAMHDQLHLRFRAKPARLVPFLSLAFVDSRDDASPSLVDIGLGDIGTFSGDGWVAVDVPLSTFPAMGDVVGKTPDTASGARARFDWSRVTEVRFTSDSGRIPAEEIVLRNIRFQR